MRRSWLAVVPLVAWALSACGDTTPTETPDDSECPTSLSLQRGEVRVISGAEGLSCVSLARTSDSTQFLIVTANASPGDDAPQPYVVRSNVGAPATLSRMLDRRREQTAPDTTGVALEARVRWAERALVTSAPPAVYQAARRASMSRILAAHAPPPAVGDTLPFHVPNAYSADICASFTNVNARVMAVSSHAIVALDVAAPPNGFATTDFETLATEFDQLILPTDTRWFGAPTDMNGDGHVTILFTPQINALTPTGSLGYVGGFYFASDLMPRSVPSENWHCDSSNEQEIFYLLTPDPNGTVNGNRFSVETAYEAARGTIGHELQHMINQGVRQAASRTAPLEVAWLNEGLAHLAEELVGRSARGYTDSRRLTWDDILVDLGDFNSFFRQNLIRYRLWLAAPSQSSPISPDALTQLPARGAAWALLRYSIDHYAGADPTAFTRALVSGPEVGVANLEARTHMSFDNLLTSFLIAASADAPSVPGLGSQYSFASWSLHDVMTELNAGTFPLHVDALPSQATLAAISGSGNYFFLARPSGASSTTLRVQSATLGPVAFAGARMIILRMR